MILRSDIYSRRGTAIIKGLAILCMLYHHLFGLYAVNPSVAVQALHISAFSKYAKYAGDGNVCVALFAFATGYGYCILSQNENKSLLAAVAMRLKRFYPFFLFFCFLFVLFSLLSPYEREICSDRIPDYLLNTIGFRHGICDYWYIGVYLLSTTVFFPILLWGKRKGAILYIVLFAVLTALVYLCKETNEIYKILYNLIGLATQQPYKYVIFISRTTYLTAGLWMAYFMVGWSFAGISREPMKISSALLFIALVTICIREWYFPRILIIFFILLGLACVLQHLPERWMRPMVLLGNYSACMWLNHRLIFGYWFADWFYSLPTPLNFFLLVALSLVASVIITKAWEAVISRLHRSKAA